VGAMGLCRSSTKSCHANSARKYRTPDGWGKGHQKKKKKHADKGSAVRQIDTVNLPKVCPRAMRVRRGEGGGNRGGGLVKSNRSRFSCFRGGENWGKKKGGRVENAEKEKKLTGKGNRAYGKIKRFGLVPSRGDGFNGS